MLIVFLHFGYEVLRWKDVIAYGTYPLGVFQKVDWRKLEFSIFVAVFYVAPTFAGDSVWRHFFQRTSRQVM